MDNRYIWKCILEEPEQNKYISMNNNIPCWTNNRCDAIVFQCFEDADLLAEVLYNRGFFKDGEKIEIETIKF
jgi:hypothetical protein